MTARHRIGPSRVWFIAAALLLAAGCSAHQGATESSSTLTEHQRDSVISRSDLPGARTVARALAESERSARRAAKMDSLTR